MMRHFIQRTAPCGAITELFPDALGDSFVRPCRSRVQRSVDMLVERLGGVTSVADAAPTDVRPRRGRSTSVQRLSHEDNT